MTWAPTETQKTIYEILSTDSALQTLLGGTISNKKIFDHVPDSMAFPYVTMRIKPMSDRANEDWDGVEIRFQIDVWWQGVGQGDLKVQQIQAIIDELLNAQDYCVDGWNIISSRRTTVDIMDDPDGRTKHGVQIFNLQLGRI